MNPPLGVTVIVVLAGLDDVTETLDGLAAMVKLPAAAVIVTCTTGEVDAAYVDEPPYCAVIECEPTASVDVAYVATPPAPTDPVPSCVAPSKNVTVPLIVPAVVDVVVDVKVIFVPLTAFVDDAESAVDVAAVEAAFTTCDTGADVDVAKFALPL